MSSIVTCNKCGLEQPMDDYPYTTCLGCRAKIQNPDRKFVANRNIDDLRMPRLALEMAGVMRTKAYKSMEVFDSEGTTWIVRFDHITSVTASKNDGVAVFLSNGNCFALATDYEETFLFEYRRYLKQR